MIFYSTGISPYLKGRGEPIELDDKNPVVDVLIKRGFISKTFQVQDEVEKPIEIQVEIPLHTEKERKKRETKKTVKTRQKRSTNR